MNATERRALIPLLKRVLNDTINHGTKSTARYWLHRLQKPRSKPARARKEAKAAQHREETQTKPEGLPAVAFPKPDSAADREKKRTKHALSTAKIRRAVFQRANGYCELWGCAALTGLSPATEMHHLEGGATRRSLQAVSNCVAACFACHRAYHHRPEDFRTRVLDWAVRHGYPVPRRFRRAA